MSAFCKIKLFADNTGKETPAQRAERIRETNNGRTLRSRTIQNKKFKKSRYSFLDED